MERLTPLERDLEIANLEHQAHKLRKQDDDLWSENDELKAKGTSWVTLLEDLKAREDDLKAKDETIRELSANLARQELEINTYKERNGELQGWFRKHYEEARAANERYGLDVADARDVTDKDSDLTRPLPSADTPVVQRRSAPQVPKSPPRPRNSPQPEHVRSLATPHGAGSVKDYAQVAATPARPTSGGQKDLWNELWEDYNRGLAVKVDPEKAFADWKQERAAKSSRPGKEQTQSVGESSTPKSGQLKAATAGPQSIDKYVVNQGGPQLARALEGDGDIKAIHESKQPDIKSAKAKRSFSQSFSEPELSHKKTKTNG